MRGPDGCRQGTPGRAALGPVVTVLHTQTHAHMPLCIPTCLKHTVHIFTHMNMLTCTHMYKCSYVYLHIQAHTRCIYMLILPMHAHTYTCSYKYSLFINTHMHAMLAYMHTHMYTCALTHTFSSEAGATTAPPTPAVLSALLRAPH